MVEAAQDAEREGAGPHERRYRPNVAALVRVARSLNRDAEQNRDPQESPWLYVLCKRTDHDAWQCPQGGLEQGDPCLRSGLMRELAEELGLKDSAVRIVYESRYWRRYDFGSRQPERNGSFHGQQQKWFLVEIDALSSCDLSASHGEFCELSPCEVGALVERYAPWKAGVFVDFLRELGLVGSGALLPWTKDES